MDNRKNTKTTPTYPKLKKKKLYRIKKKWKLQIIFTIENTLQKKFVQFLKDNTPIKHKYISYMKLNVFNVITIIYWTNYNSRSWHTGLFEHSGWVENKENETALAEKIIVLLYISQNNSDNWRYMLMLVIHTYTYTYTHTYMHIQTHSYTYIHIHMHTHTYTYAYTYIYIYIHTHIYTHIHTYTSRMQYIHICMYNIQCTYTI